jgi:hypothetical protein
LIAGVAVATGFFVASFSVIAHGEDGIEKIKGRLMAAEENTGEAHITFSQLSGITEGRIRPGKAFVFSLFVRL